MRDDAASSAVDVTREDAECPVLAERSDENEQEVDEGVEEIEEEVGKAGLRRLVAFFFKSAVGFEGVQHRGGAPQHRIRFIRFPDYPTCGDRP